MIFAPLHTGFIGLMGLLDSVVVSVGSAPPTITTQPVSNTNLNIGDDVDLSIVAAAGGGQAIAKYELFKDGVLARDLATTAVTHTFGFVGISDADEGVYMIRVTQGNGAYIESSKAVLGVLRVGLDGERLPVEPTSEEELAVVTEAELTKWVRVDAWAWTYHTVWRKAKAENILYDPTLEAIGAAYAAWPFGELNRYYMWVTEDDYNAATQSEIRILQEDGTYKVIPNLSIGQTGQGLYSEGIGPEFKYGLNAPADEWPDINTTEFILLSDVATGETTSISWAEAEKQYGFKHPDSPEP